MLLSRNLASAAVLVAVFTFAVHASARARSPEIYTGLISSTAVGGFDPVAYFRQGKPVAGSKDISWTWRGATWRFATVENRAAFQKAPEAFAPQFGGYCAWAVAKGYTAKGDPKYWKIVDGKLYLNYDARVQTTWEKDIPGNIRRAYKNWPAVLGK